MVFSVSDVYIQHDQLLWCFQYQTYIYSMISYYGVFSIRRMYTAWSLISYYGVFSIRRMYTAWTLIMVFSVSDVCIQHEPLLWCFQHQTYVYSMNRYYGVFSIRRMYTAWSISYYGVFSIRRMYTAWSVIMVFSIRRMYTAWSVIMVFSVSDVCRSVDELTTLFYGHTRSSERFSAQWMLLSIMYTCIYHDVDVRNSIGITFSHYVGCLIVMHTIPQR